MANRLTANPIYFDQFNADATLANKGVSLVISKIRVLSVADADVFQLEDTLGNIIVYGKQTSAGDTYDIDFSTPQRFNEGVIIDVSDCTGMAATDGTDAVWIYLA